MAQLTLAKKPDASSGLDPASLERLYLNLERFADALHRTRFSAYPQARFALHKLARDLVDAVTRHPLETGRLPQDRGADFYLPYHGVNVAIYATSGACALNLKPADIDLVARAALLHDAGMAEIPTTIFSKAAPLSVEESFFIQKHPQRGAELLADEPEDVRSIISAHHERFRGGGYPRGTSSRFLEDDRGMLVSIADAYDAMTSRRAYRAPRSRDDAKLILLGETGGAWSKPAVEGFLKGLERLGH